MHNQVVAWLQRLSRRCTGWCRSLVESSTCLVTVLSMALCDWYWGTAMTAGLKSLEAWPIIS
jgi:hypothetical protein